jgi:hypothetical protein
MKPKVFLGYCYCDSRFRTIEDIITKGTLEEVLEIQKINDSMPKMHRYHQVAELLKERLNG